MVCAIHAWYHQVNHDVLTMPKHRTTCMSSHAQVNMLQTAQVNTQVASVSCVCAYTVWLLICTCAWIQTASGQWHSFCCRLGLHSVELLCLFVNPKHPNQKFRSQYSKLCLPSQLYITIMYGNHQASFWNLKLHEDLTYDHMLPMARWNHLLSSTNLGSQTGKLLMGILCLYTSTGHHLIEAGPGDGHGVRQLLQGQV